MSPPAQHFVVVSQIDTRLGGRADDVRWISDSLKGN